MTNEEIQANNEAIQQDRACSIYYKDAVHLDAWILNISLEEYGENHQAEIQQKQKVGKK